MLCGDGTGSVRDADHAASVGSGTPVAVRQAETRGRGPAGERLVPRAGERDHAALDHLPPSAVRHTLTGTATEVWSLSAGSRRRSATGYGEVVPDRRGEDRILGSHTGRAGCGVVSPASSRPRGAGLLTGAKGPVGRRSGSPGLVPVLVRSDLRGGDEARRLGPGTLQASGDVLPVDDVPERLDVVRLDVEVVQVERVLPHVEHEDGRQPQRDVALLVEELEDRERLPDGVPGEHRPARSLDGRGVGGELRLEALEGPELVLDGLGELALRLTPDRKSTRLNSSHVAISYAVFCLKKKKQQTTTA